MGLFGRLAGKPYLGWGEFFLNLGYVLLRFSLNLINAGLRFLLSWATFPAIR